MRLIVILLCIVSLACSNGDAGSRESNKPIEFKTIATAQEVNLEQHAVAGRITVFDFYADWCPPCKKLDASLADMKKVYGDRMEVLKLDLVEWESPMAKQFGIADLPYLIIYGEDGKLLESSSGKGALEGPSNKILPLLVAELNR